MARINQIVGPGSEIFLIKPHLCALARLNKLNSDETIEVKSWPDKGSLCHFIIRFRDPSLMYLDEVVSQSEGYWVNNFNPSDSRLKYLVEEPLATNVSLAFERARRA